MQNFALSFLIKYLNSILLVMTTNGLNSFRWKKCCENKSCSLTNFICYCRQKIQLSKCVQINNQNDLSSHSCIRSALFLIHLQPLSLFPSLWQAYIYLLALSVCWCSNFSSENYDMLPCVIPFRKYVYSFFSHEVICICQLQFSSYLLFFLHLLCHICFWCRYWWSVCVCVVLCWCSADVYCEFSHIYFFHTLTHLILQTTYTLTQKNHYAIPIRWKAYNPIVYHNAICDLIEPECKNLRMHVRCECELHAILLCTNTTCTAIIIIIIIKCARCKRRCVGCWIDWIKYLSLKKCIAIRQFSSHSCHFALLML